MGSIPGLGRSPGEGKVYPLQYPGMENFIDCIVHGVTKSRTQLSNFHFHVKLKRFCIVEELINKRQSTECENRFTNHMSENRLISKIIRLILPSNKKINNSKWTFFSKKLNGCEVYGKVLKR